MKYFDKYDEFITEHSSIEQELDEILEKYDPLDEGSKAKFLKEVGEEILKKLTRAKDFAKKIMADAAEKAKDMVTKNPALKTNADKLMASAKAKSDYVIDGAKKQAGRLRKSAQGKAQKLDVKDKVAAISDKSIQAKRAAMRAG